MQAMQKSVLYLMELNIRSIQIHDIVRLADNIMETCSNLEIQPVAVNGA